MSRRQLVQTASSLGPSLRASSQPCNRSTCMYQQVRGIKYETFEERRRAAKEWIATKGRKYLRPRPAQTNYLSGYMRAGGEDFSLKQASQGNEGAIEGAGQEDPWANQTAVEQLKQEYELPDETLQDYRQRFRGLTPDILADALSKKWSDATIAEAVVKHSDSQFDLNEAARAEANRIREQKQSSAPARSPRFDILRPFPQNKAFKSEPVLSEELREMIYLKVVRDELTVRTVSTLMGVSMERVGAVVRMKQMERDWVQKNSSLTWIIKGKPLAVPYSNAVLDMLPQTQFLDPTDPKNISNVTGKPRTQPFHESINEIPVHPATTHQTFLSVPESRKFTRADAAKAFHPNLKSADERIPHPELLAIEKFKKSGVRSEVLQAFTTSLIEKERAELVEKARRQAAREKATTKMYEGQRWQFKIQDVSVEDAGRDGRGAKGVGWRYGMPHEDRKRGTVKIPTSMP